MEQISKPPLGSEATEARASETTDYASALEVEAHLKVLVESDFLKLMMIARVHCRSRNLAESDMEPRDLLNQAVLKTLQCENGKRWNKNISLLRHLDRAMENISGHRLAEIVRERETIVAFAEEVNFESSPSSAASFDDQSSRMEKVQEVLKSAFGDDKVGREVFELRGHRHSPSEIQSHLGISPKEYETINRRILRKISRLAK